MYKQKSRDTVVGTSLFELFLSGPYSAYIMYLLPWTHGHLQVDEQYSHPNNTDTGMLYKHFLCHPLQHHSEIETQDCYLNHYLILNHQRQAQLQQIQHLVYRVG